MAVPEIVVGKLRDGLKPSSLAVYLLVLTQARANNYRLVRVKTSELLDATGLDPKTLRGAREQLKSFRLVVSNETSERGVWEYELLNPATSGTLPDRDNVDFASISDWVASGFYHRLMPERWDMERGKFWCPFETHTKASFQVHLDGGGDKHGRWNCSLCGKDEKGKSRGEHGGFVQFVQRFKKVNLGTAHRITRTTLQNLIDEERAGLSKPFYSLSPEILAEASNHNVTP